MMGSYGEDRTILRRNVEKGARSFSARFIRVVMCISKAIPKWCMQKILELNYFGDIHCQNRTECLPGSCTDGT